MHDVDESLRALIRRDVLAGTDVEVLLDAPTSEWSARRNAPTLDLYLYDIREDMGRRENGLIDVFDEDGRVTGRARPPRFYKLSYLVTAWTQRPEDEHRLLSAVLGCFIRHDRIPDDVLTGELAGSTFPVAVSIALPPPQDRALSDVWSALGGELKPSLDLVVTAPFDVGRHDAAGPPVLEPLQVGVSAGSTREHRQARSARRPGGARAANPALIDTVLGGDPERPGRTLHFHDMTREAAPAAGDDDPPPGGAPAPRRSRRGAR